MYAGKLVFLQLIDHLAMYTFRRCVRRYDGHRKVQSFSCLDQYLLSRNLVEPHKAAYRHSG